MFETVHATRHVVGATEKRCTKIKGQNDQKTEKPKKWTAITTLGKDILGFFRDISFINSI